MHNPKVSIIFYGANNLTAKSYPYFGTLIEFQLQSVAGVVMFSNDEHKSQQQG